MFYRVKKKLKKKTQREGEGVAKTCLETNQLVASFVNTGFWLDKITRDLRHLLQYKFVLGR